MGQQPNIELEISQLPRPEPAPGPPRRWSPDRPGDIESPDDVPWGGAYGTVGPDAGYALKLAASLRPTTVDGRAAADIEAVAAAIAAARASLRGRAPSSADVVVAYTLLGHDDVLDEPIAAAVQEGWATAITGAARRVDVVRAVVASIPPDLLAGELDSVRSELSGRPR